MLSLVDIDDSILALFIVLFKTKKKKFIYIKIRLKLTGEKEKLSKVSLEPNHTINYYYYLNCYIFLVDVVPRDVENYIKTNKKRSNAFKQQKKNHEFKVRK